jgi:hypothetical protein
MSPTWVDFNSEACMRVVCVSKILKRHYLGRGHEAIRVIFIDETLSSQAATLSVHHTAVSRTWAPQQ